MRAPQRAGLVLALIAGSSLIGPLFSGDRPTRPLDPASAAHRAPGTRLWELHLLDGRSVAADAFERDGASLRGRMSRLGASAEVGLSEPPIERWFVLGSDRFGRDVLATTVRAGRLSLALAVAAGLVAVVIGVLWGAVSGLGPTWLDTGLNRTVEGVLSFPPLLAALLLAILLPGSLVALVVILAGVSWMGSARLVRGEILWMRGQDWALAAIAGGASLPRLFRRHLLPNLMGVIAVDAAHRIAALLLAEAAMSFLGFGVQPPATSWGLLLAESRSELGRGWWLAVAPGLAILSTSFALSLLGDGIRDRFDPGSVHRRSGDGAADLERATC
jgi:peptide/nickel transport system permease protein